jgi:hypothetical protein
MLRAEPLHPVVAGVLVGASAVMVVADRLPDGARAAVVVPYLLLAPGYALLPSFGREHRLLHALLALSLGVALATGIATAMSEVGWWRVGFGVGATLVLVVVAVLVRTWHDRVWVARVLGGAR